MLSIFVPSKTPTSVQTLIDIGCGQLIDKSVAAMKVDAIVEGPNGEPGQLFYIEKPGATCKPIVSVNTETQKWVCASVDGKQERGRYWLGYLSNDPPTPEYLQREVLTDGQPVELQDGRSWVVPISIFLPTTLAIDPSTGDEIEATSDRHQEFVAETNRIFEHFVNGDLIKAIKESHVVHIPNGLAYADKALAVNYRVNRDLLGALGLVGNREAFAIAEVATGIRLTREASQKKSLASIVSAA